MTALTLTDLLTMPVARYLALLRYVPAPGLCGPPLPEPKQPTIHVTTAEAIKALRQDARQPSPLRPGPAQHWPEPKPAAPYDEEAARRRLAEVWSRTILTRLERISEALDEAKVVRR